LRSEITSVARLLSPVLTGAILCLPVWAQTGPRQVGEVLSEEIVPAQVAVYQLRDYLLGRIARPPAAVSASAWTAEAGRIRSRILKDVVFHGWPREWVDAPPKFEEVGTIAGQGYRIRKFRYEIVPGFQSAALLYEPEKLNGKGPAILDVNGHVGAPGKATEYEQKRSINFARHGVLTLALEWLACGELAQKENQHWFGGHLDLVGTHELGLFYLAMRKGLDYLYEHPNVDRARLGMTGLSGGGWQTIVLSSLDERVRAAVPVAGFSSMGTRIEVRKYGDIGDVEQSATDLLDGADYTHLAAMVAPRPMLLAYNAEDDCCFRAPQVKSLIYDGIKPIYKLYGAEESFAWHENRDPGTHNYQLDNRLAAYKFFSRQFRLPPIEEEVVDSDIRSFEELAVGLPADNFSILGVARKIAGGIDRGAIQAGDAAWASTERKRLSDVVRYRPVHANRVWTVAISKNKGLESKTYLFRMDNGLSASGVWLHSISSPNDGGATILLDDSGKKGTAVPAADRVNRGEQVLAADLAFTGEPWRDPEAWGFEQILHATGDRAIGLEAAQLIEMARWLRSNTGRKQVRVETSGIRTQSIALIAAALEPDLFSTVVVRNGMNSFSHLLEKPVEYAEAPDLFCLDLFKYFDLDRLAAIAAPAEIRSAKQVFALD
jgi:dienelactone hydrolase